MSSRNDPIALGIRYAERVAARRISVCQYVRLACERFLADLELAEAGRGPWRFDHDRARQPIHVCQGLPNIKGPQAGSNLVLMDWQYWVTANIFGFVDRETGWRRFRQASIWVGRGNGKSSWLAPVALYCTFADGEGGAESYAAAVNRDQAKIVWKAAWEMVRRTPSFREALGVGITVHSIFQDRSASSFVPVSSESKGLEGFNVHFVCLDEIGSHKTAKVYDVMLTALGKRHQPLLFAISTATANTTGIGRQIWDITVKVLQGVIDDPQFFGVIYTLDEGDDPWRESSWRKANPGWDVTVNPEHLRMVARQARTNPAQEAIFKTRHLNLWIGGNQALFSVEAWDKCAQADLDLDDFEGRRCILALDIANKIDLTAAVLCFYEEGDDGELRYTFFARHWIPEARLDTNSAYPGWVAERRLVVTPGETTDFSLIEAYIQECCRRFQVEAVPYDPFSATQLAQRMMEVNVPMIEYPMQVATMSEPTKILDARMREGRIIHDGDPVLKWCVSNVVGHRDAKDNVFPRKELPANKIDGAIAAIMTVGQQLVSSAENRPIYGDRSMLFF